MYLNLSMVGAMQHKTLSLMAGKPWQQSRSGSLSVCLFVCPSVCLFGCVYVFISVCLSIYSCQ